ncbi:MAG: helicase C-terminal domain-containing protein [Thermoproteota archaeon]
MFCRSCGKYISHRNKVESDPQRSEPKRNNHGLFPYDPYPQQMDFMNDISSIVAQGGVLVAEACNGFGKTVCSLAELLNLDRKMVYATRTHEQVRQVLLELKKINKNSAGNFSAVNLASRKHLCLNEECSTLSAQETVEACRLLKERGECKYKTDIEWSSSFPPVFSIRQLRKIGEKRRICPYSLARKASKHCTLIVAPYPYIFNRHIRNRIKLELDGRILVFDEAHNADQIAQDTLSATLSERTLNIAEEEMESIETSPELVYDLLAYLEKQVSDKSITRPAEKLCNELKQHLQVEDLSSLAAGHSDLVEEIRSYKMEKGNPPICYLNGILNFLKLVDSSPHESYVAVYRKSSRGFNLVEYRCLDPSLAIKPVIQSAYGALIMSGTLSPLDLFTEILGLDGADRRSYPPIADPDNIRTIIDTSVTTRYKERTKKMIQRYGERLSQIVHNIPNGVLVFYPQRRLMLHSLNNWRKDGIIKKRKGREVLGGKTVFVEGSGATENRWVVRRYKKAAKKGRGAVLFGVFRGRNAEGSNFPYKEARGVVLIGIPYADYGDPVIKAQIRYFNRKRKNLGRKWYVMDAFKAANQAIGRGIRHKDDWCNFILMDRRYQSQQKMISPWAVENGVHTFSI